MIDHPRTRLVPAVVSGVFGRVAYPLLRAVAGVNPLVVYHHIVSDEPVPHVERLYGFRSIAEFTRDIETVVRDYRPISVQELLACRAAGEPAPAGSVLVSFDDGLRECADVIAPILQAKGVPGCFFVNSAFVGNAAMAYDLQKGLLADRVTTTSLSRTAESQLRRLLGAADLGPVDLDGAILSVPYASRSLLEEIAAVVDVDFGAYLSDVKPYMDHDQVRGLVAVGHAVGAHSVDHPRYSDLTLDEQLAQTLDSVRFVRTNFDVDYGVFAFPSSDDGVGSAFFAALAGTGEVDLCFGNQGILDDAVDMVLQRTTMEKTSMPAEAILGKAYTRRLYRKVVGRSVVARP